MLHLACVYTGELIVLSCLAHSCDRRANTVKCFGLFLASFLASFGTRDLGPTWGLRSNVLKMDWLVDADPAGEFDALWKKSTIWPQKFVAEVLS